MKKVKVKYSAADYCLVTGKAPRGTADWHFRGYEKSIDRKTQQVFTRTFKMNKIGPYSTAVKDVIAHGERIISTSRRKITYLSIDLLRKLES